MDGKLVPPEAIHCARKTCFHRADDFFPKDDAYESAAAEAKEREMSELFERINMPALTARASYLRHGTPCSAPPLRHNRGTEHSAMGGMNYHIEISFDDGIKWMARVRRFNATSPPPAVRDYIFQSEVATLNFLEKTRVPAPKVFDFALENDPSNLVGVGYILMEKLPGEPLAGSWDSATQEQKRKFMDQLSDIYIELKRYPLDQLGSLDRPDDTAHIGAFARESQTDSTIEAGIRAIGPVSSWEEYHASWLRLYLDLILREEMYFRQAVDVYLIYRYLLDLIPSVLPSSSTQNASEKYFLTHADDKFDNILVDDEFNITGIIDWEWAHTAPPARAFNSPIGLLPAGDFYDGVSDIGDDEKVFARLFEEKGHQDLADCVWNGRMLHRFVFCCGYDPADWRGFLSLFQALRNDTKTEEGGLKWDDWRVAALNKYWDDAGLQTLLSR